MSGTTKWLFTSIKQIDDPRSDILYVKADKSANNDINQTLAKRSNEWAKICECDSDGSVANNIKCTRNAVRKAQRGVDNGIESDIQKVTARIARKAAKSFPANAAIGLDGWNFRTIATFSDEGVEHLGDLMIRTQRQMAPPVQSITQLLNLLGKKNGGHNTITTTSTFHRLASRLRTASKSRFNAELAHTHDSARTGTSALMAAEDRLVQQEVFMINQYNTMIILWDAAKFYDSIRFDKLIPLCDQHNYGMHRTAYTAIQHTAPRVLKIGKTLGCTIPALGRSILARCQSSQTLARMYTDIAVQCVRDLQKTRYENSEKNEAIDEPPTGRDMYQHVDDASQLIWAKDKPHLMDFATDSAAKWYDELTQLKISVSDKSCIVPDDGNTHKVCHRLRQYGIDIDVAKQGVDLGVDTSCASKVTRTKLNKRVKECKKRAKIAGWYAKLNKRCRILARMGVVPAQVHGSTAVGTSANTSKQMANNLAIASVAGRDGASATCVIHWIYGTDKHPQMVSNIAHIKFWRSYLDRISHKAEQEIQGAWAKAYAKLHMEMSAKGYAKMWDHVMSPMSAAVASAIEGRSEVDRTNNGRTSLNSTNAPILTNTTNIIDRMSMIELIELNAGHITWAATANTKGIPSNLACGTPLTDIHTKVYREFIKNDL